MKKISLLLSVLLMSGVANAQTEALFMPETELTIVTDAGETEMIVEFADDQLETATGLMFRESIADDKGMLFDFGEPREANMWMRNVSFPIDMVFTDTDGKVLAVVSHVQPYSERRINPGFPVKSVLELADGKAISLGIKPGDQLIHPMFDSATETAPEVAPETSEDTAASEN